MYYIVYTSRRHYKMSDVNNSNPHRSSNRFQKPLVLQYSTVYCIRIRTTTCLWYLKGTVQRDFRLPGSTSGPDQRVRICLILVKNLPSYSNFKFKNLIFKIRQNMAVWSTVSQSPQEFDPPMSQCPKGSDTRRVNLSLALDPDEAISLGSDPPVSQSPQKSIFVPTGQWPR